MTDSQRLWESWYQAFLKVHEARPADVDVPCPNSDHGRVRISYTGDPETRIGMAIVWCAECRQGIHLSRVGIPAGADMLTFDATEAEEDAAVPPDIEILPPDPAPPSDAPGAA
jgi:hypothetical protein